MLAAAANDFLLDAGPNEIVYNAKYTPVEVMYQIPPARVPILCHFWPVLI